MVQSLPDLNKQKKMSIENQAPDQEPQSGFFDSLRGKFNELKEKAEDTFEEIKDKAGDIWEETKEKAEDLKDQAEEKWGDLASDDDKEK